MRHTQPYCRRWRETATSCAVAGPTNRRQFREGLDRRPPRGRGRLPRGETVATRPGIVLVPMTPRVGDPPASSPPGRSRRRTQWRWAALVAGMVAAAWLYVFLVVNGLLLVSGVVARAAGNDPRLHDDSWPGIPNLRMVDDQLLVGGQPSIDDYRALAAQNVTLVIDMRTGTGPGRDDAAELATLGVRYATVPIVDGRAPTPAQTRRFLELVESANGRVYAHCGGGVGRSTTIAASYQAAKGEDPSVLEQLATGPPTLEQVWYVATLDAGKPEQSTNPVIAIVSRTVDMPRTAFNYLTSLP
jgi:protein tyrosine phosphatase (PTP) superfamily phosphohydrolase (DUF442 family)